MVDDHVAQLTGDQWRRLPPTGTHEARCLLAADGTLFVGTSEAHLYRLAGSEATMVDGFERADGRERWHTPWGGPPDTRSLARDTDGSLYANVHVGGVLRSADGSAWQPTMEIEADVHQVASHRDRPGCAVVASARGLGVTFDGGANWEFTRDGLHSAYCRAVAVAGETVLISASAGPSGGRAAVYRRPLRGSAPLERCRAGVPEWFDGNIDSGCLVASGAQVAFGTADGHVYRSADAGATWSPAASGLPPIRVLAVSD